MSNDPNIIDLEDYRGKRVIFTRAKFKEKQSDHPELSKNKFLECIKRAITLPDEVWEDYQDSKK